MNFNLDKELRQDKPFLIAGPCVAESTEIMRKVAEKLKSLSDSYGFTLIFKASFEKANRLSGDSYHGPGIDEGLKMLQAIGKEFDLPLLTDVHESSQISAVAEVADIIQIPAFLCRQTELVRSAGATGKWVNIKKGQFLAPEDMTPLVKKTESKRVMVTERGVSFGYRALVVDFRSLVLMRKSGALVVFDATHSLQQPGAAGGSSSGQPEFVIPFARAAAAVGVDGMFVETHPNPAQAKSDSLAMIPLSEMEKLINTVITIDTARKEVE
ncbi:3-deoxy-8-phosphooctulonate synthase [Gemmatimonas aurantiaca]|nr:3-deoxy-8-phosphooctulonate synthase [Gemmatimonas aurantiaca]